MLASCWTDRNKVAVVKLLLQRGANVNLQDKRGWTALMGTMTTNRSDRGIELTDHFLSISVAAATADGPRNVKLLLQHNANVNLRTNEDDDTALHLSVWEGKSLPVVKELLENKADVHSVNKVHFFVSCNEGCRCVMCHDMSTERRLCASFGIACE